MRLILISNRLPVTGNLENREVLFSKSTVGLAKGLSSYLQSDAGKQIDEYLWIGWPGLQINDDDQGKIKMDLKNKHKCVPVFYSEESYRGFYVDFCNSTLWPLFHSFHT